MRDRLLTVAEVADWLSVSRAWVNDHANGRRRPMLPSVKMGKCRRFRGEQVEEFLKACGAL